MENELRNKSLLEMINFLVEEKSGITEIEANGTNSLFIKEFGKRKELENIFENEEAYIEEINKLIPVIMTEDENELFRNSPKYLAEGKLKFSTNETARVHIVLPPASELPQLTIAKKSNSLSTLDLILKSGSMNSKMYNLLLAMMECNQTIVLCGGTGAGKTTLLEALTEYFKPDERIGVVEDIPELNLKQKNVTYLHSTLWVPGRDPNDIATLSWCVQQINRQRTDKLIIGETRGKEFFDFIVGANSGMEGSLTTIHANDSRTCLQKMSQFVMLGQPQPVRTANQSIATSIDFIVQLGFNRKGENRILEITEVTDTLNNDATAAPATNPIFTFNQDTDDWIEEPRTDKFGKILDSHGFQSTNYQRKLTLNNNKIPRWNRGKENE